MGIRALVLLSLLLSLLLPLPALAWGPLGHEIVAEIAARHLSPRARTEVERLLGDRAGPAMRQHASWADALRAQPGQAGTGPWHYVNFPRDTCTFDARRDCPQGRCAVLAIPRFVKALHRARTQEKRAQALKWLIHLVGDLHQPLHAGYADDRGGNTVQLRVGRQGTNLHALLDSGLLDRRGWRATAYADWLERSPLRAADAAWTPSAAIAWAEESCRQVPRVYPPNRRIGDDYVRATRGLLEVRLALAGHRLAALLNAELDADWPASARQRTVRAR